MVDLFPAQTHRHTHTHKMERIICMVHGNEGKVRDISAGEAIRSCFFLVSYGGRGNGENNLLTKAVN